MAKTTSLPAIASGEAGLTRYLQDIRQFPMLQPEEEFMLAKRWKEHGDAKAAQKLITSHLRLVAKLAMGYRGYGLPIGEVISEGNVGLMQAVKKFEPDKGFIWPPMPCGGSRPRFKSSSSGRGHWSRWAPRRTRRSCSSTCAR